MLVVSTSLNNYLKDNCITPRCCNSFPNSVLSVWNVSCSHFCMINSGKIIVLKVRFFGSRVTDTKFTNKFCIIFHHTCLKITDFILIPFSGLTTGQYPLSKRALHRLRSSASYFNFPEEIKLVNFFRVGVMRASTDVLLTVNNKKIQFPVPSLFLKFNQ